MARVSRSVGSGADDLDGAVDQRQSLGAFLGVSGEREQPGQVVQGDEVVGLGLEDLQIEVAGARDVAADGEQGGLERAGVDLARYSGPRRL